MFVDSSARDLFGTLRAEPERSGFLSCERLRLTAAAIAAFPPDARKLAARLLLRHLGLPSPGLRSPHLPMRSPLVLYLSQPPPPAPPALPLPNQSRRFSSKSSFLRRPAQCAFCEKPLGWAQLILRLYF